MALMKLMTNILPMYYAFIEKQAKHEHKTKREVVEEALDFYIQAKKRQEILKAYQAMANDHDYRKEMKAMAEEGMGDYLKILDDDA